MDAFIDLRPLFPYVGPVPRVWGAARPVSIPQAYLGPYLLASCGQSHRLEGRCCGAS